MASKNIFSIDGAIVKNFITNTFTKIGKLRFKANSQQGKKIIDLPFIAVLIIGILLPFLSIILLIIGLVLSIKINIELKENDIIVLDKE